MQLGWRVSGLGGRLEWHDSLSPWSLVHKTNTETEAKDSLSSRHLVHRTNERDGVFYYSHPCSWLSAVTIPHNFSFVTVQTSALHFKGVLGFVSKPPYLCLGVLAKWQPHFCIKICDFQRSKNYSCVIMCCDTVLIAKWLQTSFRKIPPSCLCLKEERP